MARATRGARRILGEPGAWILTFDEIMRERLKAALNLDSLGPSKSRSSLRESMILKEPQYPRAQYTACSMGLVAHRWASSRLTALKVDLQKSQLVGSTKSIGGEVVGIPDAEKFRNDLKAKLEDSARMSVDRSIKKVLRPSSEGAGSKEAQEFLEFRNIFEKPVAALSASQPIASKSSKAGAKPRRHRFDRHHDYCSAQCRRRQYLKKHGRCGHRQHKH